MNWSDLSVNPTQLPVHQRHLRRPGGVAGNRDEMGLLNKKNYFTASR